MKGAGSNVFSQQFPPSEPPDAQTRRTRKENCHARPVTSNSPTTSTSVPSNMKERGQPFGPAVGRQSRVQTAGPAPFRPGVDSQSHDVASSRVTRMLSNENTVSGTGSNNVEANGLSERASSGAGPSIFLSRASEEANTVDPKVRKPRVQARSVSMISPKPAPPFSTTLRSKQSSLAGQRNADQRGSRADMSQALSQGPSVHALRHGTRPRSTIVLTADQNRVNIMASGRRSNEETKRRSSAVAVPNRLRQDCVSHTNNLPSKQSDTEHIKNRLDDEAEARQEDEADETDGEDNEEEEETWLGERTQRRARPPSIKTEQELEERYRMQGQGKRRGFCYPTNEPRESHRGDTNFGATAMELARAMAEMEVRNIDVSSRKGTVQQKPAQALGQIQQLPHLDLLPSATDAVDQWDEAQLRSYIANLKPPIKTFYEKFKKRRIDELRVAVFRGMENETEMLNARGVFEPKVNALRVRVKTRNAWHYALRHYRVPIQRDSLKEALRLPAARYSKPEDSAETSLPTRLFDLVTRPEPLSEECPRIEIFPVYKMMADWLRRSTLPV